MLPGQRRRTEAELALINARWRLLEGDGSPAADCGFSALDQRDCGPLPAAGNPYRIEVQDSGLDEIGDYSAVVSCESCTTCEVAPVPSLGDRGLWIVGSLLALMGAVLILWMVPRSRWAVRRGS